jgi:superfamily I DNA and/or RNA helicase
LPAGVRVGTVNKFQGQQTEVVIVSMTTSNEEYLPRFIDFLYSTNRLNVALSRAKSLALLVALPEKTLSERFFSRNRPG